MNIWGLSSSILGGAAFIVSFGLLTSELGMFYHGSLNACSSLQDIHFHVK